MATFTETCLIPACQACVPALNIAKNAIVNGSKGWLNYSDITWITAGTIAGLAKLVQLDNGKHVPAALSGLKLDPLTTFKTVAIAGSIYTVVSSIIGYKKDGADVVIHARKNNVAIIATNAMALTAYFAHRMGLLENMFKTLVLTVGSFGVMGASHYLSTKA